MEEIKQLDNAVMTAINIRDKALLSWQERDALAVLINIAEDILNKYKEELRYEKCKNQIRDSKY